MKNRFNMKKIFFFAMMAIATLGLTACGDDNEDANGPLVGTQWLYSETVTDEDEDGTWVYTTDATLKFNDATNGSFDVVMSYTLNGQSNPSYTDIAPFTYTYEGTATEGTGSITVVDQDGESTAGFTVRGNELEMVIVDDETGQVEEAIVFTKK